MADFCGFQGIVARPKGAYDVNSFAGLVWLPDQKWSTENRQSRGFLANQYGPETRLAPRPGPEQRARKRPMPKGSIAAQWVYFIECGEGGPIKIGIAQSVYSRMAALQSANPHPLECLVAVERIEARFLEEALHERFAEHHIRGEWFRPAPELVALIDAFRTGEADAFRAHECTGRIIADGRFHRYDLTARISAVSEANVRKTDTFKAKDLAGPEKTKC